jgi:Tfp pilus assembly protein PilE
MAAARNNHHAPPARANRGFTAVEMMLALLLTGFIAVCVLSMTSASSQLWRHQQEAAGTSTTGVRAQSYLERILRSAKDVGYWSAGSDSEPAALLLWAHDQGSQELDATRDHQIQTCELVLIRHDPAAGKIKMYRAADWSTLSLTDQLLALELVTPTAFGSRLTADTFATLPWVREQVLAGVSGEEVSNAVWEVDRTGDNPVVRMRFDVSSNGYVQTINVTVSLRIRNADDDWSEAILELGLVEEDTGDSGDGGDGDLDFSLDLFP